MPSTDYFTYGYAALVASGGLMGFVKAGEFIVCFLLYFLIKLFTHSTFAIFPMLCWTYVFKISILCTLGSLPSLGMGILFGSLLGYGAHQTSQNPNNYYLAFGTSLALGAFMGKRFLDSGKIMPAGIIASIR